MAKKLLKTVTYLLAFGLLLGIPFEHFRFPFWRSLSRNFLKTFQETASFAVEIPGFIEKKIHLYASDLLIIGLGILLLLSKQVKWKDFYMQKPMRWLWAFLSVCLLSILASPCRHYYTLYFLLTNLAWGIIFYLFVSQFFKNKSHLLSALLVGIVFVGSFEAFIALGQFLMQSDWGLGFLGEPKLEIGMFPCVLPLTEKGRYLVELFGPLPENQTMLFRSPGTFLHPNILAGFLAFTLGCSHFVFCKAQKKWQRLGVSFLIALQIFSLFLTFSRAGVLSYLFGTITYFGCALLFRTERALRSPKLLCKLGSVIVLSLVGSMSILYPHLEARGGFFGYNAFVQQADYERILAQKKAIALFKQYPVLGVGYHTMSFCPPKKVTLDIISSQDRPHNTYLLILAETGLIGLICFSFFLFYLLRGFFSPLRNPYFQTFFSIVIGFVFIGLCDIYFVISQVGKLLFFGGCGLLSAATFCYEKAKVKHSPSFIKSTGDLSSVLD